MEIEILEIHAIHTKYNIVQGISRFKKLFVVWKRNNLSNFIFLSSYFLFYQAWFYSQAQFILRRLDPRTPTSSPFLTVSGGRWSQWPPLDTAIWRMALCFKYVLLYIISLITSYNTSSKRPLHFLLLKPIDPSTYSDIFINNKCDIIQICR